MQQELYRSRASRPRKTSRAISLVMMSRASQIPLLCIVCRKWRTTGSVRYWSMRCNSMQQLKTGAHTHTIQIHTKTVDNRARALGRSP